MTKGTWNVVQIDEGFDEGVVRSDKKQGQRLGDGVPYQEGERDQLVGSNPWRVKADMSREKSEFNELGLIAC